VLTERPPSGLALGPVRLAVDEQAAEGAEDPARAAGDVRQPHETVGEGPPWPWRWSCSALTGFQISSIAFVVSAGMSATGSSRCSDQLA
jgi:hypothetical protein